MSKHLKLIQELVDTIENNLAEDINSVALAKSASLSPWHFQRLFKSLVGDTLGGYIRGRRLTKAAALLLTSKLGIIDIAFAVGFNSHEAFTRSFKAYFTLSPKDFRLQKPRILLNEKPLLTNDLFHHIGQDIQREPIITLKQEQTIIGYDAQIPSPFIPNEGYCDLLYDSWMQLFDNQSAIQNKVADTFLGLSISESGNFTEECIQYIAGSPVTQLSQLAENMVSYHFPEQLIALFKIAHVDKDTTAKTIDYIYGYWLPNSNYLRGQGCDYELFEGVKGMQSFEKQEFTAKYVIPIIPKK